MIVTGILGVALGISAAQIAERFLAVRIPLLGSFAGLQLSHNSGIAFGFILPPVVQELLIGLALVVVAWMAIRSIHSSNNRSFLIPNTLIPNPQIAYGLILGGGLANIIDRLPDGLVTDYFQIGTFPVFNVADSFITIGVLMLILEMLVSRRCEL